MGDRGSSSGPRSLRSRIRSRMIAPSFAPIAASGSSSSSILRARVDRAGDRDRLALAAGEHRHLGVDRARVLIPMPSSSSRARRRISRLSSQRNGPKPAARGSGTCCGDGQPRDQGEVLVDGVDPERAGVVDRAEHDLLAVDEDPARSGWWKPDRILISVDLPAPLSPISPSTSPCPRRSLTSRARSPRRSAWRCSRPGRSGGRRAPVAHLQPPSSQARDLHVQRPSSRIARPMMMSNVLALTPRS